MTQPTPDELVYDYRITGVRRVVDGDTFDLELESAIDFGFYIVDTKTFSTRFRLYGFDAVELSSPEGKAAKVFTEGWFSDALAHHILRCRTYKADNFGRWLADPYVLNPDGSHTYLRQALKAAGYEKDPDKWVQPLPSDASQTAAQTADGAMADLRAAYGELGYLRSDVPNQKENNA